MLVIWKYFLMVSQPGIGGTSGLLLMANIHVKQTRGGVAQPGTRWAGNIVRVERHEILILRDTSFSAAYPQAGLYTCKTPF